MTNLSKKTNKIARNTFVLYVRMLIVLVLSLYTSRLVLKALGVEDFGLYNVVGGVVGLFAFFRSSMEMCTQRFLNVEMVKEGGRLRDVFRTSCTIHIIIALCVFVASETVGLWFLNNIIQIPVGREVAANWIYQFTILSLIITVLTIPYSSTVISHEKMTFYAIVNVLDAVFKVIIAIIVSFLDSDHLIYYGFLIMFVSLINIILYIIYCQHTFLEAKFGLLFDKILLKRMFGFTSWTLAGQMTMVGVNQGNVMLVNMFHSVTANAAMSVGSQVTNAVVSLTSNFQTAFTPQITLSYASKDYDYLRSLIFTTSKFSFLLLFIVSLPLIINIDYVLEKWLVVVPEYSAAFCIITMINGIINAVSMPFNLVVISSGKIKWYQIALIIAYLADIPILFILFSLGVPPYFAMVIKVLVSIVASFIRFFYANRFLYIGYKNYSKQVLVPIIAISVFCLMSVYLMNILGANSIIITSFSIVFSLLFTYFICLSQKEQLFLKSTISSIVKSKLTN